MQKRLKLKEFANGRIPDCQIVSLQPIKRVTKTKTTNAIDEVVRDQIT